MSQQSARLDKDTRRTAIMKAAMEIFSEKGYDGTSLNAIIDRVGGSKRNFYTEFGGKEGLFRALITEKIDHQIAEQMLEDGLHPGLREALLGVARRVVGNFGDAEFLALYRFAILEGVRFPEVVRAFFETAHLRGQQYIARILENAAEKGEADISDCPFAAEHFVSMLHGSLFYELLFGMRSRLEEAEVEAFVSSAVDLFLNGIRTRAS